MIENVKHTHHFSHDGTKTKRIPKRCQPWSGLEKITIGFVLNVFILHVRISAHNYYMHD